MSPWCRMVVCAVVLVVLAVPGFAENARQLTNPPAGYSDAWAVYSPRGDKVAFGRYQQGVGMLQTVFVADVSTGAVDSLVTGLPPDWNPNGGLEWSPDGRQIAFMGDNPGVGSSVWIADVAGAPVPRMEAFVSHPDNGISWAVDSNGVLYRFILNNAPCVGIATPGATILGNLFGGEPPSPVLYAAYSSGTIFVVLQNGDVWYWCESSNSGVQGGNVFVSAGVTAVGETNAPRLQNFMSPNRPNPFNPATRIPYTLAIGGRVGIRVFDAAGRLVRTIEDAQKPRGAYTATWGGETDIGSRAGSGTYFLRITYPDGTSAEQKLTVLK